MTSSRSRKRNRLWALLPCLAVMVMLGSGSMASPAVYSADIPASVDAGEPFFINITLASDPAIREVLLRYDNPTTGIVSYEFMALISGNETNGTWSFQIPAQSYDSDLEYGITAKDITGSSVQYPADGSGTIRVIGEKPPKPFPWNLVIIMAFLGVAMIATELIFKPGFYRPTGRQRAKKLEEEDRKRELEESKKD